MKSTKYLIISIFLFIFVHSEETSGNKDGTMDVEKILQNERLVKNYVDCLMDKGKCTKEGLVLKKAIPDALETRCAKCSEKEKMDTRRVIKYLQEKKPKWWKDLTDKYDSDHHYEKQLKDMSKKEKA